MLAVIKAGGKQFIVSPGEKIQINPPASLQKQDKEGSIEGKEIIFDQVLLLQDDKGKVEIGTPIVEKAKAVGKIIKHGKNKKVIIFKYKPKTRSKTKKGHRQPFVEVEILKIGK